MTTTSDNNPTGDRQQKSRLDREIEEILSRSEAEERLPPPPTPIRPRPVRTAPSIPPRVVAMAQVPILQALVLGFAAWMVDDLSHLLANLLALAAVVCIILPMVRGVRPSTQTIAPETRMWRGQVIDTRPQQPRTPVETLRDWWNARRR
jgi:hypothetical protein